VNRRRKHQTYLDEVKFEGIRLYKEEGVSAPEIAKRLELTCPATVHSWLHNQKLVAHYNKDGHRLSISTLPIQDLESEEQKLERQLTELRSKKQALIEADKWRFTPVWNGKGVLIKKGEIAAHEKARAAALPTD
jgi:transposase-like protein